MSVGCAASEGVEEFEATPNSKALGGKLKLYYKCIRRNFEDDMADLTANKVYYDAAS